MRDAWRDVAIMALAVLFVWSLISRSLEPNLVVEARAQRDSALAVETAQALRIQSMQTEVARLETTPTPRPCTSMFC